MNPQRESVRKDLGQVLDDQRGLARAPQSFQSAWWMLHLTIVFSKIYWYDAWISEVWTVQVFLNRKDEEWHIWLFCRNMWRELPEERRKMCTYLTCYYFNKYALEEHSREKVLSWINEQNIFSKYMSLFLFLCGMYLFPRCTKVFSWVWSPLINVPSLSLGLTGLYWFFVTLVRA